MLGILSHACQFIIDSLAQILTWVLYIFPPSPFNIADSMNIGGLLGRINYFVPVYEFIAIGQAWLIAIGIYYGLSTLARWAKTIQ